MVGAAAFVALLFVIALIHWIAGFRRALSPHRRESIGSPPTDQLAPDALAQWVQSVRDEPPEGQGEGEGDARHSSR